MKPPSPGRWRGRCGWLLLAQGLWLPLLLVRPDGPWEHRQGSGRGAESDFLPPLPAVSGYRSRPPSLGELLAPTAPKELAPGLTTGHGPAVGGSTGVILLNRPRAVATSSGSGQASPDLAVPAVTGQGSVQQGASIGSRQSKAGPPVAGRQLSPSQLLGGSLGLEELGGTGASLTRSGSSPAESPRGASAPASHP